MNNILTTEYGTEKACWPEAIQCFHKELWCGAFDGEILKLSAMLPGHFDQKPSDMCKASYSRSCVAFISSALLARDLKFYFAFLISEQFLPCLLFPQAISSQLVCLYSVINSTKVAEEMTIKVDTDNADEKGIPEETKDIAETAKTANTLGTAGDVTSTLAADLNLLGRKSLVEKLNKQAQEELCMCYRVCPIVQRELRMIYLST